MMRFLTICGVCLWLSAQAMAQSKEDTRPNIILFLVDDMGWQDTSVPFYKEITANNRKYNTPNMERLAKMGVKFTNAYATSVCTPTRVSLMSGMSAARHQVTNWTNSAPDKPTDAPYEGLRWPNWNYNGMSRVKGINNTVYITPMPEF